MAGRESAIATVYRPTGAYQFTQVPQHEQLHGQIDRIKVIAFNYDLTPIEADIVPRGVIYKPLLLLREVFTIDERTARVVDFREDDLNILLPLDDDTLDLRDSTVLHEPHKSKL